MARRDKTLTDSQGSSRPIGVIAGFVLKTARLTASLTQEALASALDLDVTTVQGWESGRRPLASTGAGELLRLGQYLARSGAPVPTTSNLHEAIYADLILTAGLHHDGNRIDLQSHPLASGVLRRSTVNLLTWPFTGKFPEHLGVAQDLRFGRGPVGRSPFLDREQKNHFFDHLTIISDRSRSTGEELLHRQSAYLLGFDSRPTSLAWIRDVHDTFMRNSGPLFSNLQSQLAARSAAVALASTGDMDRVHAFVNSMNDQGAELVNLNYWAHWIGETRFDHIADDFMLADVGATWTGDQLFSHLLHRARPDSAHRPLNLRSLHSLVSYKPDLLHRTRGKLLTSLSDRLHELESFPHLSQNERDQAVGLIYALRLAQN